jgi:hypothetical protein
MSYPDEAVDAALARLPMEVLAVITRDEVARAISAAAQPLMAQAWDEGREAGYLNRANERWVGMSPMDNPYKSGEASVEYRKVRTVTTVEQLDSLVSGSGVLDRDGDILQRDLDCWRLAGYGDSLASHELALPATVLYEALGGDGA